MDDILTRLRAIPGAESVGLAGALPVAAGDNLADGTFLLLNGQKPPANFDEWGRMAHNPSQAGYALYCVASEAYFRTLGIPLIRGRMFGEQDDWNSPHVAVISESLARERWPHQDPIGQVINFGNMDGNLKPQTIVGIAGDVRARGLDSPPSPVIYVDYRQRGMQRQFFAHHLDAQRGAGWRDRFCRARYFPRSRARCSRQILHLRERNGRLARGSPFPATSCGVVRCRRSGACGSRHLRSGGLFGGAPHSGDRHSHGARRAAQRRTALIVGEGARLAVLGVAIGILASFVITRLLSSLLFGVSATDPVTFAGVAVLLSAVALLASYIPARRAMRLDPNTALRYE
jgi:putative ABC transport system permease protein